MAKLAGFSLAAVAAAVAAAWAISPSFTEHAHAIPEATQGISPLELQERVDIKSLPVQDDVPAI